MTSQPHAARRGRTRLRVALLWGDDVVWVGNLARGRSLAGPDWPWSPIFGHGTSWTVDLQGALGVQSHPVTRLEAGRLWLKNPGDSALVDLQGATLALTVVTARRPQATWVDLTVVAALAFSLVCGLGGLFLVWTATGERSRGMPDALLDAAEVARTYYTLGLRLDEAPSVEPAAPTSFPVGATSSISDPVALALGTGSPPKQTRKNTQFDVVVSHLPRLEACFRNVTGPPEVAQVQLHIRRDGRVAGVQIEGLRDRQGNLRECLVAELLQPRFAQANRPSRLDFALSSGR